MTNDVESQKTPLKRTSFQKLGPDTESFLENGTRSKQVECLSNSRKSLQETSTDMKAICNL